MDKLPPVLESAGQDEISNFSFPFPPYDIQKAFMRELYTTLEAGIL